MALHERGRPVELPLDVQLAVYRLVQEALTNALRHAPGTPVEITLDWHAGRLGVRVVNDLLVRPTRRPAQPAGGGHGLLGMQERVTLLGGTLEAGPSREHWHVAAQIPLPADTARADVGSTSHAGSG